MRGRMVCEVAQNSVDAFDFLSDIRNERSWNPRVLEVEKTSSGAVGPGTTFSGRYKGIGRLDTELTEFRRPELLRFRSSGPRMRIDGTFTLWPTIRGTGIVLMADFRPRGVFRVLLPLMSAVLKTQNAAAARRLEETLGRVA